MVEEKGFESVQDKILRSFLHSLTDDLYSAVLHRNLIKNMYFLMQLFFGLSNSKCCKGFS